MKFDSIILDIKRMIGLQLNSIKPGANIIITSVDIEGERIFLTDSSNNKKSRPFDELRRIWDCLCINDVAHVDTVLSGSGSSRNQPETIFANLPYIEWLIIANKKHLRFVGDISHPIGTLKQMDSVATHQLKEKINLRNNNFPSSIHVIDDIKIYSRWLEALTGISPLAVSNGVYKIIQTGHEIWIVGTLETGNRLEAGIYPVLNILSLPSAKEEIIIAGITFYLISRGDNSLLLHGK